MIYYHKLIAEHGTFLLIGTTAQAVEFSRPYTAIGASLETCLHIGCQVLHKDELKEYSKSIIL